LCKSSKQRQNKIDGKDLLHADELMIAVTFALPAESSGFLRRLHNKSRSHRNGVTAVRGEIDHRAIEVFHTGVGEKTCRQRIRRFLQDQQFDYLISAGFAGALNDQLQAGDLLLAKNFSIVDLSGVRSSLANFPVHMANLLTVPSMIESREERNKIAQTTGALAVDMETEFIARACTEHGVPLLSLRAITDTLREPFPAPAKVLFDIDRQQTSVIKLVLYLVKHPSAIPRLIVFARRVARARSTLAHALLAVVRNL
jgi:nucleoside phosphorylase